MLNEPLTPTKGLRQVAGNGWRWGDRGKIYYGPSAKELAVKQGQAILRAIDETEDNDLIIFPYGS